MSAKAYRKRTNLFILIILIALVAIAAGYHFSNKIRNYVVLIVFNGKYDVEAENLLASIKKNSPNLLPHINVCVSDKSSRDFADKHHLKWFELPEINAFGDYSTKEFNFMMQRKIEAILYLLKQGKNVVYMDTDIVFLGDPIPYISSQSDISFQIDSCNRHRVPQVMCAGFMYINANKRTIAFMEQVIQEMIQDNYQHDDQWQIQLILRRLKNNQNQNLDYNISFHPLDACKFQNGCRYFTGTELSCRRKDAIMVHNNYIIGIDNKMRRFYENNLIFN